MYWIGAHVSVAGGLTKAPDRAAAIGARAFALFTRNQRQWAAKPLAPEEIASFKKACQAAGYGPGQILAHGSYLINLGHSEQGPLTRSRQALIAELRRCEALGIARLCLHPGSHLRLLTEQACLARIAASLNQALVATEGVTICLENTAGQGSNLGWHFTHLARLLAGVRQQERIGVCLDTAHAFAAGYDLRTEEVWQETLEAFDRTIGFGFLRAAHLNDSRAGCGSRLDRHASLGEGQLGLAFFARLLRDRRFTGLPLILETPQPERWAAEIALLYGMAE